jgi:hypothetical protein
MPCADALWKALHYGGGELPLKTRYVLSSLPVIETLIIADNILMEGADAANRNGRENRSSWSDVC